MIVRFDLKVSLIKAYVRAKVTNPAIEAKNLVFPTREVVIIEYEYQKFHKNVSRLFASHVRNQDARTQGKTANCCRKHKQVCSKQWKNETRIV